jgi:DNA-binding NtrC family response regulator
MSIRVLVADHDESLREAYERSLAECGFQVFTAATGPDCLKQLREHVPYVLVLEPDLPGVPGQKLTELIRDASHVPTVPVVIVSRHERDQQVVSMDSPIWAYHVKPVAMDQLVDSVRTAAEQGP